MHAWNGERGIGLARQVAALAGAGCNVRVLAGVGFGPQVTRILRTGLSATATAAGTACTPTRS